MTKTELRKLYQDDSLPRRVRLTVDEQTVFTDADLTEEGITLEESVNPGTDLEIGAACSVSLKFSLKDFEGAVPPLEGKEVRYQSGIQTGETHWEREAKQAKTMVLCREGAAFYGGFSRPPYLRVWTRPEEGEPALIPGPDPEQPDSPVEAILIVGDRLYCCHGEAPYLTGYSLTGLNRLPPLTLTPFGERKARWYAEATHIGGLNVQGDSMREYRVIPYDGRPVDLVETEFTFSQIGLFLMGKPEKENLTQLSVSCLDRMSLFDQVADDWVNNLSYPISALDCLKGLCQFVGVPLNAAGFLNSDYRIQKNYAVENATGRQLLQLIGQLSASFLYCNPEGELEIGWYRETGLEVTPHQLWSLRAAEYETAPIDKLQIRGNENDIGVIVGEGANALVIQDNFLLYAESDRELRPIAEQIFNAVKETAYRPFELEMTGNPLVRAGDILTVTAGEVSFSALVMEKRSAGTRDSCSATGGRLREIQSDAVHQSIQRLRGRTNELIRTIDETISRLYDAETGDINTLKQTAKETSSKIESLTGDLSEVIQTAESLSAQIQTAQGDISRVEQTASGLKTQVEDAEKNIAKVEQTASGLTTQVEDVKKNVSKVEQTASGLTTQVSGVNSHLTKVEQKIDGVTTTVQGSGGTSVTRIKPSETEFSFNGISGSGGVKISASGLRTSGSSNSGVELFDGHIILNDGGNHDMILRNGKMLVMDGSGNSIGYLGKVRWEKSGKLGLAINMDVDTFVMVGFYDESKGLYIAPMAFNNGGIDGPKGILVWHEIHSTYNIYAPAFVQTLEAAPMGARTFSAPIEVQMVSSPQLLTEETGTESLEGETEIFLNSRIPFTGYTVFLTPIGGTAWLKEKKESSFVVEGDAASFDYCVKYQRQEPRARLLSMEEEGKQEDPPNRISGPGFRIRGGEVVAI